MATATVSITFEATDEADADAKVEQWTLHEGCTVFVSVTSRGSQSTTDESGNLVPMPPPPPWLSALDPVSVIQNGGQVTLRTLGSDFSSSAVITFGGVQLPTAFVSSGELYTTIDASLGGHAPGTFDVLVRQDGTESMALPFTIKTQ